MLEEKNYMRKLNHSAKNKNQAKNTTQTFHKISRY